MAKNNVTYQELVDIGNEIGSLEMTLCKMLMQPFYASNSGGRKILASNQLGHSVPLPYAEVPDIGTGYENKFGDESASIIKTDNAKVVEAIIPKFKRAKSVNYYMILRDDTAKEFQLYHRVCCEHSSECYGILFNNAYTDTLVEGDVIPPNTIIRESSSYDAYHNRMDVINVPTLYLASDYNMQDSIIISKTTSIKGSTAHFAKVDVTLNLNNIPLNYYGTKDEIKSFPDIGEEIKGGILMAYRVQKRDEALFNEQLSMLSKIKMSDSVKTIPDGGTVVDIDILCNDPINMLQNIKANRQLFQYYQESIEMMTTFVNTVNTLQARYPDYGISYDLSVFYEYCKDVLSGKFFMDGDTVPNGTLLRFTVIKLKPLKKGDKMADRFGGKGVISCVIPDELMPMSASGIRVGAIVNQSTCTNRENFGQLDEITINSFMSQIIRYIKTDIIPAINTDDYIESDQYYAIIDPLHTFLNMVAPKQAESFMQKCTQYIYNDDGSIETFLSSILDAGVLKIQVESISDVMTIDVIAEIMRTFPFLKNEKMVGMIKDSNGNYRQIESRRPVEIANKAMWRLKQYSDEKLSVTSSSAVNIQGLNSKSKSSKNHFEPYPTTPIAMGGMENGDLGHLGVESVVQFMMIHSVSPTARRLVQEWYTGDPMVMDLRLNANAVNRNAEIVNVYLLAKGYELTIKKIPKNKQPVVQEEIVSYNPEYGEEIVRCYSDQYFDTVAYMKRLIPDEPKEGEPVEIVKAPIVDQTLDALDRYYSLPCEIRMWLDEWGEEYKEIEKKEFQRKLDKAVESSKETAEKDKDDEDDTKQ